MQSLIRLSDGMLLEVNATFTRVLGYTRDEVVGKMPHELNLWVRPDLLFAFRERLMAVGHVRGFEVEVRAKDGSVLTILLSSELVEIDGVTHAINAGVDITERKLAEANLRVAAERLRLSEERFSKVFHANPAMVALTRVADGKIVSVNDAFVHITGYTAAEAIGQTTVELGVYARPEVRRKFLDEVSARGFVRNHEHLMRTKDGRLRTVLVSTESLDVDGAPHLLTVGLDVTDRTEAQEKLKESEARLRDSEARLGTAFRACPIIMTVARLPEARYVEVNDAFTKYYGYTRAEAIGRTSEELGLWVDAAARDRFFAELEKKRSLRHVECQLRRRDGKIFTMQLSADIIEINREPHLLAFALDITQRVEAEQNLRASEARLRESETRTRVLYESISAAVVVHDARGFLQTNQAALQLFGAENAEDFLGRHPPEFSAPVQPDGEDSATAAQRHMARAYANGHERFEWLGRKIDGTLFPLEVTLTTLQLEGRTVIQAVMLDLSERKRAEAELQNALEKERELSQLKTDFVALVSHEFRTPLEIIMSSVDNLDRYHDRLAADKRQQLLRTINKSVRRMSGMMEEVLLLGRLDSGSTDFRPMPIDLAALCHRVRDEMESATNRRCPITVATGGELTGARGDEAVLRHILSNLLSNAVKYSAAGQPVKLTARRDGATAEIRIVDRGCGIPAADQARLFQAFHRGSNAGQVHGTGLGLLIVRRCVDRHGGEIRFESVEGKGTTFIVRLPLFSLAKGDGKPARAAKKSTKRSPRKK